MPHSLRPRPLKVILRAEVRALANHVAHRGYLPGCEGPEGLELFFEPDEVVCSRVQETAVDSYDDARLVAGR